MIPEHVAIIMDGNGRWATKRGLPRSKGHLEGSKNLEKLIPYIFEKGVKVLSLYAFSTENFKRSEEEVDYLMNLFTKVLKKQFKTFQANNIKVVFSKREEGLPISLEKLIDKIENENVSNPDYILNICLNYSGSYEIVDTTKKLIKQVINKEINIDDINPDYFLKNLYQDLPAIDLLIRTSGEYRLSNFMLFSLAYSELYFTEVLFPDFSKKDFDEALEAYQKRDRRFGLVK